MMNLPQNNQTNLGLGDYYSMNQLYSYWQPNFSILDNYCLCDHLQSGGSTGLRDPSFGFTPTLPTKSMATHKKEVKPRKRRNSQLDIEAKLVELKAKLQDGRLNHFSPGVKKIKGVFQNKSGRRSRYTGVSKNNMNWQVLINHENVKKYVGTYPTEIEAAKTYDLYSMAFHGSKAKVNFLYSKEDIITMIDFFLESGKVPCQ